ncbi:hypothetical protein WD019_19080 [Fictibacillus sp. Mic-4]|uniref:hypothetical protein n=1 Tax=Fictibacillus TaxID=1329200 RepID=UPI00041DACA0|nr:hypothetical protein [Fictibacillus gelatini]HAJ3957188.1 hypothetical protein [Escherichia coli]
MKKWGWIAVAAGIALVASIIMNLVFYDFWQQEKEKAAGYKKDLTETEATLEAVKQNKENFVLKDGETFIKEMFTFNSKKPSDAHKRLSKLMTKEGYAKLFRNNENVEMERSTLSEKGVISDVKIKDSQYNKLTADTARVNITFERSLGSNGNMEKQVYQATLAMKYQNGKWLVESLKLNELI